MAAADEHTAWVQRANARRTFLDRASGSDHDISWANSTSDEPHSLEVLKTDEVVHENRERSRAWATEASRHDLEDAENNLAANNEDNSRSAEVSEQNTANKRPTMFEMSIADGTTLQVPTEWAMYMAAVDKKFRQIEESTRLMTNSIHQPNANSTRRESAEGIRRVTFTDLTPAGRSDENLREETQIRSVTPRPDMSGRGLPPPGQRQHFLDARTPPPTTPLSRRTGLGGV